MASRLESKYPVLTVHSLGLQTICETSQMQFSMPDAAASSNRTGRVSMSSPDDGINSRKHTGGTVSKNLLDPGDPELLPLKKEESRTHRTSIAEDDSLCHEQGQDLGKKEQEVSPASVSRQRSAHRSGSSVTPKSVAETQTKSKKERETWKDLPTYYSIHRHTRTTIEVNHNTPARRPDSGMCESFPTALVSEAVDTEHIPVGDHWGSLKLAGMSIKKALSDPEFASKWNTEKEEPAGFMSMIHMLFNQVQEAAWPCHVQAASGSRRLLITITIMGRVGALRLWVTQDTRVKEVIGLALLAYEREARCPVLGVDSSNFELYLSPYTSSVLPKDEKISDTGARTFVLWGPGLTGPDSRRRIPTSCAQENQMGEPFTYTSLHLYDSGAESPTEVAKFQHRRMIPGIPWLPSTLMRCIPV